MTASRAVSLGLALCGLCYSGYALAFGSAYTLRVLSLAGIFALASLGYQFIFGHAGALALSQGTFMGLGAYVSGILAVRYGVAFDSSLALAVAAPVLLAGAVAVPVLRLRTHYFALATLIIGQIALSVVVAWEGVTGGANGIGGVPAASLWGIPIRAGWPNLALVWCCVGAGATGLWLATRGQVGRAYALMRAAPAAAGSVGIDIAGLRLAAFLLSAAYAGAAGALYVHTIRVVSPDVLGLPIMITLLTIAVIGGRTRIAGAIAGAVLIVELPEWFRVLRDSYLLAYGCILLLVVVTIPDGLIDAAERLMCRLGLPDVAPALPPLAAVEALGAPHGPGLGGALIAVEAVTRSFGGLLALDGVSLSVRPGEVVGLIGPNGSGKTTLVNVITGLHRPDAGRIVFHGHEITRRLSHRIARAGIARTFQEAALVDTLTALDNVALACPKGRTARAEAAGLLRTVGAADAAPRRCASLPPGTRRLVEIARALATRPRLLLLDEPAAGLNETEQAALASRLRRIADGGTALLIVEHNMPFLASLCDRLVCLDAGRVIAEGSLAKVRDDPRVIEAYLGRPPA